MILGIGCDIVEISRVEKATENPRFLSEYFSAAENAYLKAKNMPAETIAGAFAAKEAFSKALGTGFRGFSLNQVEVLHDGLGKPYFHILPGGPQKGGRFLLSVSHCKSHATAFVVWEGEIF